MSHTACTLIAGGLVVRGGRWPCVVCPKGARGDISSHIHDQTATAQCTQGPRQVQTGGTACHAEVAPTAAPSAPLTTNDGITARIAKTACPALTQWHSGMDPSATLNNPAAIPAAVLAVVPREGSILCPPIFCLNRHQPPTTSHHSPRQERQTSRNARPAHRQHRQAGRTGHRPIYETNTWLPACTSSTSRAP